MSAAEDSPQDQQHGPAGFPQYRRTTDGRHYYRIDSPQTFTEIQRVGSRCVIHEIKATAYPEMVRIHELLYGVPGRYEVIPAEIWHMAMQNCETVE